MMRAGRAIVVSLVVILATTQLTAQERFAVRLSADEATYLGKPLSYWMNAIRSRDEKSMSLAFDAIRYFGPDAAPAVPELTRLLQHPFKPIDLGRDSDDAILDKLYEIELRSGAIDALASIGEAAAPAAMPLIDWTLALRVVPGSYGSFKHNERFIDLVTLEVEYRLAAIHAVRRFGDPVFPIVTRLLRSKNAEERKLAVMILGIEVLPIVEGLLKSRDCESSQLGITILKDMEPLAAKPYLDRLQQTIVCVAN
jgi:hypothetical protein